MEEDIRDLIAKVQELNKQLNDLEKKLGSMLPPITGSFKPPV